MVVLDYSLFFIFSKIRLQAAKLALTIVPTPGKKKSMVRGKVNSTKIRISALVNFSLGAGMNFYQFRTLLNWHCQGYNLD
jgi:hypothetical protein